MWLKLTEAVLLLVVGAFAGAAVAGSFCALTWQWLNRPQGPRRFDE